MIALRRITTSRLFIPEVDGLRFIAIAMVVFYHLWSCTAQACPLDPQAPMDRLLTHWLQHGDLGVQLFFNISGFILAVPFLRHHVLGESAVSLRKYYLRRVTRLEPPYILTLILFYALALALRTPDIADPDFVPSFWRRLFYLNNAITGHTLNLNGVTWSLEVEIQFYLVVPLLAVVFRLPQTPRRFLMAAIVSAGPFFRFLEIGQLRLSVLNFAEYFLAGFLLADLYVTRGGRAGRGSWVADVVGLAALVTVLRFAHSEAVLRLLAWLLFAVAYAGLFGRWTPRVLAVPAVSLTGGMCYTIYLLHYPVLSFLADRVLMPELSYPIGLLRLALTALPVVAVASVLFFVLVERPCMIPDWPQRVHRTFRRWTAGPVV